MARMIPTTVEFRTICLLAEFQGESQDEYQKRLKQSWNRLPRVNRTIDIGVIGEIADTRDMLGFVQVNHKFNSTYWCVDEPYDQVREKYHRALPKPLQRESWEGDGEFDFCLE